MANILLVCTANQCRSPMAEAMFRQLLVEQGLDNWNVASAGTRAIPGAAATSTAVEAMRERQLDLSSHRSQPVTSDLLKQMDVVIVMERRHQEAIENAFPEYALKVQLLGDLAGTGKDVADPVGEPIGRYRQTADEMLSYLKLALPRIRQTIQESAS